MVELKLNDQAKKLGAITTFLDIPVTVSSHKSLNSSKGVIRSRDLRYCSKEEIVEELSGVTRARRIKVRRDEDKIQTDTVVLIFDLEGLLHLQLPEGLRLPYGVPSLPLQTPISLQIPPPPPPPAEKPQGPYPFTPKSM
ncbi:Gag-like protein [Plakobranchus ocellatus]|uniref:Gag-like protein n=1 Tax=Plakobranchus ocellatus TaxID=259542 RepID=A0AAV4C524_9GAST|nr:Gag-like protein [Plakobranchus ocellatus]